MSVYEIPGTCDECGGDAAPNTRTCDDCVERALTARFGTAEQRASLRAESLYDERGQIRPTRGNPAWNWGSIHCN